MKLLKSFTTLFLLALAPIVSAHADDKVYLSSDLISVTDDGITVSLLNENISLDTLYADEGGIYVLSDELFSKGYWQCDFCNEYHPNSWDSCPVQNLQVQQDDSTMQDYSLTSVSDGYSQDYPQDYSATNDYSDYLE
jgi:hypothetical protein